MLRIDDVIKGLRCWKNSKPCDECRKCAYAVFKDEACSCRISDLMGDAYKVIMAQQRVVEAQRKRIEKLMQEKRELEYVELEHISSLDLTEEDAHG